MKVCILRDYSDRAKSGEECTKSVKEDSCVFLLTAFGVLILGEASCSLFILTGVLQSNVFGVLVNDFLVACKISGFTIYVTVFL